MKIENEIQINTIDLKDLTFKSESVEKTIKLLIENGFTVLTDLQWKDGKKNCVSYATFGKGNNVGSFSIADYFGGVRFSTVHKANRNCGTGFSLQMNDEAIHNPTLKDIEESFVFAPNWAEKRDRDMVIKYKGISDYINSSLFGKDKLIIKSI